MTAGTPRERKPFSCFGCGCGAAVALALAAVVTLTLLNYRASRGLTRHRDDPAAAAAEFERVLPRAPGAAFPAGYRPLGGMRMPLGLMAMAVLAGEPVGEPAAGEPSGEGSGGGGGAGVAGGAIESGFFFVELRDWSDRESELRAYLGGKGGGEGADGGALRQAELDFEPRGEVSRGELRSGAARVLYRSRRGELGVDQERLGAGSAEGGAERHRFPGLVTQMLVDCGDDRRLRVALWFSRDPAPAAGAPSDPLAGTPGDPRAIADLLDRFLLCG